jgi:hypothetical protein
MYNCTTELTSLPIRDGTAAAQLLLSGGGFGLVSTITVAPDLANNTIPNEDKPLF